MASLERQLACGACLVAAAAIRPAFVSLGYLPAGLWLLSGRPLAPALVAGAGGYRAAAAGEGAPGAVPAGRDQ